MLDCDSVNSIYLIVDLNNLDLIFEEIAVEFSGCGRTIWTCRLEGEFLLFGDGISE